MKIFLFYHREGEEPGNKARLRECLWTIACICWFETCTLCVYVPALHEEIHEQRFSVWCPL